MLPCDNQNLERLRYIDQRQSTTSADNTAHLSPITSLLLLKSSSTCRPPIQQQRRRPQVSSSRPKAISRARTTSNRLVTPLSSTVKACKMQTRRLAHQGKLLTFSHLLSCFIALTMSSLDHACLSFFSAHRFGDTAGAKDVVKNKLEGSK